MNDRMPALYIGHGAPPLLDDPVWSSQLAGLAADLPRPRAIVIVSAHWESAPVMLSADGAPLVYDFGGFAERYYRMTYATPPATALAQRVAAMMPAGEPVHQHASRGLDHGAWVPLMHLYPKADIPVVQISVQPTLDAAHHLRVGRALAPLPHEDILVIGSGHMTHNLREWMQHARTRGMQVTKTDTAPYVDEFRVWIDAALRSDDPSALASWQDRAPHATRAHPSDEHFLPLPVAYAAAGPSPDVEHIDAGVDAGVLAMDAYLFHPRTAR